MATILLDVNIIGNDSLEKDFKEWQIQLAKEVQAAMDDVGADMRAALARHVDTDVYGAYTPKEYERRGDGGLGAQAMRATIYNHGAGVSLEYKPSGNHENASWHTADTDELIGRIENKNPPYFKAAQRIVPKRLFWKNFVDEMVDDGELEDSFVRAMQMRGEEITADGNMAREANDGSY